MSNREIDIVQFGIIAEYQYTGGVSVSGTINIVTGSGTFDANGRAYLYHGFGDVDHFTEVTTAGTDIFDDEELAQVGEIYVKLGSNEDIVYTTGGTTASGYPYIWMATISGIAALAGGGGSGIGATVVHQKTFNQATSSPLTIFTPIANSLISKVQIEVLTAAAGGNPSVSVGTSGDPDRDMKTDQSWLNFIAVYEVTPNTDIGASPVPIILTITPDGQNFSGEVRVWNVVIQ